MFIIQIVFFRIPSPQTNSLGGLSFGTDGDGNYGYYGADGSLIPFKSYGLPILINSTKNIGDATLQSTIGKDYKYAIVVLNYTNNYGGSFYVECSTGENVTNLYTGNVGDGASFSNTIAVYLVVFDTNTEHIINSKVDNTKDKGFMGTHIAVFAG